MEHRKNPRVKVSIIVDWSEAPACIYSGRITSLSVRGCFIQTDREAIKGGPVFIRFMVAPESQKVLTGVIYGRVLYHFEKVGLGVEFKRLRNEDERDLQDLINFYRSSNDV